MNTHNETRRVTVPDGAGEGHAAWHDQERARRVRLMSLWADEILRRAGLRRFPAYAPEFLDETRPTRGRGRTLSKCAKLEARLRGFSIFDPLLAEAAERERAG